MSINSQAKRTQAISQNTLRLMESMCKNPEAFMSGLGKNSSGHSGRKRRHKRKYIEKFQDFDHSKRTEKLWTQTNPFNFYNQMTLPGQFQEDTSKLLDPIQQLVESINSPQVQIAIANMNNVANNGVKVHHNVGMNDEVLLVLCIIVLIGGHYSKSTALKVIGSLGSLIFTLKIMKPNGMTNILQYVFNKVRDACGPSKCDTLITEENIGIDTEYPEILGDDPTYVTQTMDISTLYRTLVVVVAGCSIYKNYGDISITSIRSIDEVARKLNPINSLFKTGGDILTTILDAVEYIINLIGGWFTEDFKFSFKGEIWYEIEVLRRKLRELKVAFDNRQDLGDVARKARTLKGDLAKVKIPQEGQAYTQFRDVSNAINILVDDLARFGAVGNDIRQEPFSIMISGPPGVGKSLVSAHMLDIFAHKILSPTSFDEFITAPGTFIYTPNQTEKFNSGYTNQPLVVVDDLGFSPESLETMVPRYIQMVNSLPYNMEQAELHRKGNVYFDSKLIMATSNITNWAHHANKLTCTEALCRRMHLCLRVKCKPEYATESTQSDLEPKLDIEKIKGKEETACWVDFTIFDPAGRKSDHKVCKHSLTCLCDKPDCEPAALADIIALGLKQYDERKRVTADIKLDRKDRLRMIRDQKLSTIEAAYFMHSGKQPMEGKLLTQAFEFPGECANPLCMRHASDLVADPSKILKLRDLEYFKSLVESGKLCNENTCGHTKYVFDFLQFEDDIDELRYDANITKFPCICTYEAAFRQYDDCAVFNWEYLTYCLGQYQTLIAGSKFYHGLRYCRVRTHQAWERIVEFTEGTIFDKFLTFIKSPVTIGLTSTLILALAGFGLFKTFFNKSDEDEVATKKCTVQIPNSSMLRFGKNCVTQAFDSFKENMEELGINVDFGPEEFEKNRGLLTQSYDTNSLDILKCLANHNVMQLYIGGLNPDDHYCTVFGLCNEVILMNKHAYDFLVRNKDGVDFLDQEVIFSRYGKKHKHWKWTDQFNRFITYDTHCYANEDLIAVKVPNLLIKDISGMLSDDELTSRNTITFGISWYQPKTDDHDYNCYVGPSRQPLTISEPIEAADTDGTKYVTTSYVKYQIPTTKGMCGAPVVLMDSKKRQKLVGIHCAGNGTMGYGVRFTRTMFDETIRALDAYVVQYNVSSLSKEHIHYDSLPTREIEDCSIIGKVTLRNTTLKSEIMKSPVYGIIRGHEPNLLPAILVPTTVDGKKTCPIEKNLAAYARGTIVPDQEILDGVTEAYVQRLRKLCAPPARTKFLSFEESVTGIGNLGPINRGTSAGYPDCFHMTNGKRGAFGEGEEYTFNSPQAIEQRKTYDEAMLALENGPIEMIANIFPKDELRPRAKAKALKTRLISGFSCSATLVIRTVFGPMVEWYMDPRNRIQNCSAVGVNPSGYEWQEIAMKHGLGAPNYDVKAGDYSSFDKTLNPFHMNKLFVVWKEFFGSYLSDKENIIADNCWKSILNVAVVCKDNLVFWGNSNASGGPLTTLINTICNTLELMSAITRSLKRIDNKPIDLSKTSVVKLWNNIGEAIELTCYGDDHVFSVKLDAKVMECYHNLTYADLSECMARDGFVYTDEKKSAVYNEERRNIFEVSFLKRSFYKEGARILAPLDMETITQKIQWKKKNDNDNSLFFMKFETFISELAVHPKEIYDKYHKILFDALECSVPNHPISKSRTQDQWRELWSRVMEAL
jgi:hypothetical protein